MAAPMTADVQIKSAQGNKGRGLFACRPFKSEDVILHEAPLISCQFAWNKLYKYTACDHCLRSLETAEAMAQRLTGNQSLVLPYMQCCDVKPETIVTCPQCQVAYCSKICRDRALLQYHRSLCLDTATDDPNHPINKLIDTWRNMHYPPETASIMLLLRIIAMVKQADDKSATLGQFNHFVKATVNEEEHAAHKLLGKQFQGQLDLLREMVMASFYDEAVQQWLTPEGFQSMFALMGTNQQGIGSSSVSVWVDNCDKLDLSVDDRTKLDPFIDQMYEDLDKVSGSFLNCEGVGLYTLQSSCNHSCVPNAEIKFSHQDHTLTLMALTDVDPEQEITISYLGECDQGRSRHSRQKLLRENYLFVCDCPKCQSEADDPDVTSDDDDDEDGDDDMD